MIDIHSSYRTLNTNPPKGSTPDSTIKAEPMFFRADFAFVCKNGGPLTLRFISNLARAGFPIADALFDSRSHMLMPGFYPCIPGWHHDYVPRTENAKQPNYSDDNRAEHAMMLVNADVCPTNFAVGNMQVPEPKEGEIAYQIWDPLVRQAIKDGKLIVATAKDDSLIFFDDRTWHEGVPAVKRGWRFFIRASIFSKEVPIAMNEIRNQVQVYLTDPYVGW